MLGLYCCLRCTWNSLKQRCRSTKNLSWQLFDAFMYSQQHSSWATLCCVIVAGCAQQVYIDSKDTGPGCHNRTFEVFLEVISRFYFHKGCLNKTERKRANSAMRLIVHAEQITCTFARRSWVAEMYTMISYTTPICYSHPLAIPLDFLEFVHYQIYLWQKFSAKLIQIRKCMVLIPMLKIKIR